MAVFAGVKGIFVLFIAFKLLVGTSEGQIAPNNDYPKYKFLFNIQDKGLHTREEESALEGHVTGKYSYMDPNGFIRVIHYNSTPETGYIAYGDTGVSIVSDNTLNPSRQQSTGSLPTQQTENQNDFAKYSGVTDPPLKNVSTPYTDNHVTHDSKYHPASSVYFRTSLPQAKPDIIAQPSIISNSWKKMSENFYSSSPKKFVTILPFNETNGENKEKSSISENVNEISKNTAELEKKSQQFLKKPNKVLNQHLWRLPVHFFPYIVHPVPHLMALHPGPFAL